MTRDEFLEGRPFTIVGAPILKFEEIGGKTIIASARKVDQSIYNYYCNVEKIGLNYFAYYTMSLFGQILRGKIKFEDLTIVQNQNNPNPPKSAPVK